MKSVGAILCYESEIDRPSWLFGGCKNLAVQVMESYRGSLGNQVTLGNGNGKSILIRFSNIGGPCNSFEGYIRDRDQQAGRERKKKKEAGRRRKGQRGKKKKRTRDDEKVGRASWE